MSFSPSLFDVDNQKRKELEIQKYSNVVGKADGRKRKVFAIKFEDEGKEIQAPELQSGNSFEEEESPRCVGPADNTCSGTNDAGQQH